jgi:hypothetical protein
MLVTLRLPGLPQKKLEQAARCVIVWAHLSAKKAVQEEIKRQGLKVSHHSAKEITIWADLYFDDHREKLLAEATEQLLRR